MPTTITLSVIDLVNSDATNLIIISLPFNSMSPSSSRVQVRRGDKRRDKAPGDS